jgi:ubiquinol-cytochrome c reductase iron-sulfur subunit
VDQAEGRREAADMMEPIDYGRRRMLTVATMAVGTVGLAFTAVPFIDSWEPSARAKALGAPVSVDASKLEDGQMLKIIWRGQPVFVIRRQMAVVAKITILEIPYSHLISRRRGQYGL